MPQRVGHILKIQNNNSGVHGLMCPTHLFSKAFVCNENLNSISGLCRIHPYESMIERMVERMVEPLSTGNGSPLHSCHKNTRASLMLQARLERERLKLLTAGRRQREASLVGDFSSDEIYNLNHEEHLAMQQALWESRCRIESLCQRRKLASSMELATDNLMRELQSLLTRCARKPMITGNVEFAKLQSSSFDGAICILIRVLLCLSCQHIKIQPK